jgi:PAS domain S-box-containing protein
VTIYPDVASLIDTDPSACLILASTEAFQKEDWTRLEIWIRRRSPSDCPFVFLVAEEEATAIPPALNHSAQVLVLYGPSSTRVIFPLLLCAGRTAAKSDRLHAALADLEEILGSTNDAVMVFDRAWRFVYVNARAAEFYRKKAEDLVGSVQWEVAPDLFPAAFAILLTREAKEMRPLRTDFFHPLSERWFDIRLYPAANRISIFASDITERKRVEESLRYQLNITQAITDNAADSLFLLDECGCVTFMNPTAELTFGWNKEELLGRPLHDFIHSHRGRGAEGECPLQSIFTSGLCLRDLEDRFRCKDGSSLFVSCSNAPLRIDGKVSGSVLVVHDITYHKLAEQQLKALNENLERRVAERTAVAEQRASQLSALASELTRAEQRERRRLAHILHDNLQQILVATKLQVGAVRRRLDDPQAHADLLHIEELISRSVDESRSLTVELSPPILYDAGLGPALDWLARRMQQEHRLEVELQTEAAAEPTGDDVRAFLFQAAREFLFNVVKHAGVSRARVTLARTVDHETCLVIQDEGRGFKPDPGKDHRVGSSGFGLFSIRERLEFMGGRMQIESEPNSGTCVSLWLPLREQTGAEAANNNSASELVAAGARRPKEAAAGHLVRVLLADDHKMLRDGLAGLLREQPDIEVVSEASDGEMAVELARQLRPDVIIMDVTMPRMNGVEATRRIHQEFPEIKIIGLSMHEKEDMAKAMREAGAVNYVTKGAPSEILTAAIRECMKPNAPVPLTVASHLPSGS